MEIWNGWTEREREHLRSRIDMPADVHHCSFLHIRRWWYTLAMQLKNETKWLVFCCFIFLFAFVPARSSPIHLLAGDSRLVVSFFRLIDHKDDHRQRSHRSTSLLLFHFIVWKREILGYPSLEQKDQQLLRLVSPTSGKKKRRGAASNNWRSISWKAKKQKRLSTDLTCWLIYDKSIPTLLQVILHIQVI